MNTRRIVARRLEDERMNEDIPPKLDQFKQFPQDGKGVRGSQVAHQGDHIPNVEGGNEVTVVHLDLAN